jgi:hypothetical protein
MIAETNEPIAKSGYLASSIAGNLKIKVTAINRQKKIINTSFDGSFILVDGLIIHGKSGGPVVNPKEVKFKVVNGQMVYTKEPIPNLIIGIVSQGWENTGLTVVYSADNILDIIDDDLKINFHELLKKTP